ncbi:alpha-1,2-fucosyltransferase [Shewanella sp. CAL98-MNA-CIBAN-0140]|uniref:alpha-1,2-fucosyltransferase n=2 Tax=Gammaproteobacteria TaxID=1236 RepID=UPI00331CC930
MIKIKIIGGLGNQLFQYAAARALATKLGVKVSLDISAYESYDLHPFLLDKFNCNADFYKEKSLVEKFVLKAFSFKIFKKFTFIFFNKYYIENDILFDNNIFKVKDNTKLFGYFQSEMYFADIREQLLQELTLIEPLSSAEMNICNEIKASKSVSLHIRRGDYLYSDNANKTHGVCNNEFFEKSISYLENEGVIGNDSILYIFSDDIAWCRNNLNFKYKMIFVDGNSNSPEIDMFLMSQCDHHIISNSTFSWWSAWLNPSDNKVVVSPELWFKNTDMDSKDIIPKSWIRL